VVVEWIEHSKPAGQTSVLGNEKHDPVVTHPVLYIASDSSLTALCITHVISGLHCFICLPSSLFHRLVPGGKQWSIESLGFFAYICLLAIRDVYVLRDALLFPSVELLICSSSLSRQPPRPSLAPPQLCSIYSTPQLPHPRPHCPPQRHSAHQCLLPPYAAHYPAPADTLADAPDSSSAPLYLSWLPLYPRSETAMLPVRSSML
jgi:hypothetical protein